ncbi:MAG TPA: DeoR/GlpR family DNA-binding transcription regulator [Actinomadura sp.]|jgi:DeoR/GlpR family transcriptional regulator of sugar metabolism|nr:DeoR/GlpR family DNA-binding transcription regulator [Actinomadura sp.]
MRRPRARTAERRALLAHEIADGNGNIHDLAERFGISPSTIRRDLAELQRLGQVTRTYGGAVGSSPRGELPLRDKERGRRAEKDAIARTAAELVQAGETVLLDAGTTTGRLAWHLRDRTDLTVVVAGLNALLTLAERPGIELVVLGGRVRHPSEGIAGPFAQEQLRWIGPDRVFLGADGLTANGLCTPSPEQAHLKHTMLHRGRHAYVLADSAKLGTAPFAYWTPLDRDHCVITDAGAGEADLAALSGEIVIAPD